MLHGHRRAAFCGRRVGDNKKATSNKTPANQCFSGLVGTICLVGGIVCSGPRASRAAQMPVNSAAVGNYIKLHTNDQLQSATAFTCPDGQWLAGKYVKCFPSETAYIQQCSIDSHVLDGLTMQNFTSAMCDAFATPSNDGYTYVGTLTDERDGTPYVVRKYSDGHCWLAENLKLCSHPISTGYNANDNTSVAGYVGTYGGHAYKGKCRLPCETADTSGSCADYDGYLYNWEAAMNNATAVYNGTYDNRVNGTTLATHDICPLGWHLPQQTEWRSLAESVIGGEISYICNDASCAAVYDFFHALTTNNWNASARSTVAGHAQNSGAHAGNQNAYWWSGTLYDAPDAYTISIFQGRTCPGCRYQKFNGFTVRCLADY
ncbi:hypothetical protein IJJ12_02845 [bacterium]|nr:hypothetical protein [bacterium]